MPNKKSNRTFKRDKRNFDIQKFQSDLFDEDLLVNIMNSPDTNIAYDKFLNKYCTLLDKHAPLKNWAKKKLNVPKNHGLHLALLNNITIRNNI